MLVFVRLLAFLMVCSIMLFFRYLFLSLFVYPLLQSVTLTQSPCRSLSTCLFACLQVCSWFVDWKHWSWKNWQGNLLIITNPSCGPLGFRFCVFRPPAADRSFKETWQPLTTTVVVLATDANLTCSLVFLTSLMITTQHLHVKVWINTAKKTAFLQDFAIIKPNK